MILANMHLDTSLGLVSSPSLAKDAWWWLKLPSGTGKRWVGLILWPSPWLTHCLTWAVTWSAAVSRSGINTSRPPPPHLTRLLKDLWVSASEMGGWNEPHKPEGHIWFSGYRLNQCLWCNLHSFSSTANISRHFHQRCNKSSFLCHGP